MNDSTTKIAPSAGLKRCSKCGVEKPATTEFFSTRGDGLYARCRICRAEEGAARHLANRDENRTKSAAYYVEHREERLAYALEYRLTHGETISAWYLAHRDEQRARCAAYSVSHKEELAKYHAKYRANNKCSVFYRKWRSVGCIVCSESNVVALHAHHLNPKDKENKVSQIRDMDALRIELAKCVPICANHHAILHHELHDGHKGCSSKDVIEYLRGVLPAR